MPHLQEAISFGNRLTRTLKISSQRKIQKGTETKTGRLGQYLGMLTPIQDLRLLMGTLNIINTWMTPMIEPIKWNLKKQKRISLWNHKQNLNQIIFILRLLIKILKFMDKMSS